MHSLPLLPFSHLHADRGTVSAHRDDAAATRLVRLGVDEARAGARRDVAGAEQRGEEHGVLGAVALAAPRGL